MKDQFVTYEIALKLKELGFNEECLACYTPHLGKGIFELISKGTSNEKSGFNERFIKAKAINGCAAPLWQQVIDWFRDEPDIVIEITRQKYFDTYANSYAYEVVCKVYKNKELEGSVVIRDNKNNHIFYSYEEAREQAILKAIQIINGRGI